MPEHCAAYCCHNRRTVQNRDRGVTFHKFPKERNMRRKWEVALRREGFTASDSSVVCSEHFKQGDFDRTGQIVRLRAGATPSVFSFPADLQTPVVADTSQPQMTLSEDPVQPVHDTEPVPGADHSYALPTSPSKLRSRLSEALARVESLEREKRRAEDRERRDRNTIQKLQEDVKRKNLINAQLKKQLDLFSDNIEHILTLL